MMITNRMTLKSPLNRLGFAVGPRVAVLNQAYIVILIIISLGAGSLFTRQLIVSPFRGRTRWQEAADHPQGKHHHTNMMKQGSTAPYRLRGMARQVSFQRIAPLVLMV